MQPWFRPSHGPAGRIADQNPANPGSHKSFDAHEIDHRIAIAGTILLVGLAGFATVYAYAGWYGVNSVFKRGGTVWARVALDDLKLPSSMQLALQEPAPAAAAGSFSWHEVSEGFEVTELPVLAQGKVVDRLLLARIDPTRFRFVVRTSPPGDKTLSDWMHTLHPALIINGSYFGHDGRPDTPLISAGVWLGPRSYPASHGAFIASSGDLFDLRQSDWQTLFRSADDALVSSSSALPLKPSSRSTVLPAFCARRRSNIKIALNLDGGPVACQGIELNGYRRDFCGDWEMKMEGGQLKLLQRLIGNQRWGLPIVIAALPK